MIPPTLYFFFKIILIILQLVSFSNVLELVCLYMQKSTGVPFSRRSSQPRDRTQASHPADGFFTVRATGKPQNTGDGSLSLSPGIFLTQGSNQGLPYCRYIHNQLSYQGSQVFNNNCTKNR